MLQFYLLSQSWALWEIRANNLGNKYLNPDNNDNLLKAPKRVTDIGDIAAKNQTINLHLHPYSLERTLTAQCSAYNSVGRKQEDSSSDGEGGG